MVDDMGYSDLGVYGSEINTPNIDKLAREGLRLKQFYNNGICAPTRASLISGQYPHTAGIGYFDIDLGLPAYQGYLNDRSLTLGEVFKAGGYKTYLSGKWHVGKEKQAHWPLQRGFDRFFGILNGASSFFDAKPIPLGRSAEVLLLKDNERVTETDDSFYLTDEITRSALGFIDEGTASQQPFFLYLAYTAPHWPLHAQSEDIAKYKGSYNEGWDVLREKRLKRQVELGIISEAQSKAAAEKDADIPAWINFTYEERQLWQSKMEVYAAMLDRVDKGIGDLLAKLKEKRQDGNTLIIFISDNGAPAEDVAYWGGTAGRNAGPVGTTGSFESQGKGWSYLSNTPFRAFKASPYEGGISSPFIAWYPDKIKDGGRILNGAGHLIDIAPTLYDIAGVSYPPSRKGQTVNQLPGLSLKKLLFEKVEVAQDRALFWEWAGNRAVRRGKWKLVSVSPYYQWELYNLEEDPGERNNQAQRNTKLVGDLSTLYFAWAEENGVADFEEIKPKLPLLPKPRKIPAGNRNF